MRRILFERAALLLFAAGLVAFYHSVGYLTRRDYVASLVLLAIGVAVLSTGKEVARMLLLSDE